MSVRDCPFELPIHRDLGAARLEPVAVSVRDALRTAGRRVVAACD
jgi:hypothetical protein